ncbi:MAG: hypothetical protein QXU18_03080 [Thermoplasmatales archaeon]
MDAIEKTKPKSKEKGSDGYTRTTLKDGGYHTGKKQYQNLEGCPHRQFHFSVQGEYSTTKCLDL